MITSRLENIISINNDGEQQSSRNYKLEDNLQNDTSEIRHREDHEYYDNILFRNSETHPKIIINNLSENNYIVNITEIVEFCSTTKNVPRSNINKSFIFDFNRILETMCPCSKWLRHYSLLNDLPHDVLSGITLGIIILPVSMSDALTAGLPVQYGLYASIVPILVHAYFSSSVQSVAVCIGPTALAGIVMRSGLGMLQTTPEFAGLDKYQAASIQCSFLVGILFTLMGTFRLGSYLTDALKPNILSGFMSGAVVLILGSQFQHFIGYSLGSKMTLIALLKQMWINRSLFDYKDFCVGILSLFSLLVFKFLIVPMLFDCFDDTTASSNNVDDISVATTSGETATSDETSTNGEAGDFQRRADSVEATAIGQTTTNVIDDVATNTPKNTNKGPNDDNRPCLREKQYKTLSQSMTPILITSISLLLSHYYDFHSMGIKTVGRMPPELPRMTASLLLGPYEGGWRLISTSIVIAVMGFIKSIALTKMYARTSSSISSSSSAKSVIHVNKNNNTNSNNADLIAIGFSNIIGSAFQSIPVTGDISRSSVFLQSGGRSTIGAAISAIIVVSALVFGSQILETMPNATLAAIVYTLVVGMMDLNLLHGLLSTKQYWEGGEWSICFVVTCLTGIELGLLACVLLTFVSLVNEKLGCWVNDGMIQLSDENDGGKPWKRNKESCQIDLEHCDIPCKGQKSDGAMIDAMDVCRSTLT